MKISPINSYSYKKITVPTLKQTIKTKESRDVFFCSSLPNKATINLARTNKTIEDKARTFDNKATVTFICDKDETINTDTNGYSDLIKNNTLLYDYYIEDLRHMQWNNGKLDVPSKWYVYEKTIHPGKYASKEEYLEALKKKIMRIVTKQEKELSKIKGFEYPHTFYRGVNLDKLKSNSDDEDKYIDYMNSAKVGDIITPDWTPSCASKDVRLAFDYNNENLVVIRTKKGAKLFSGNHMNREVMFPSQAQFKVLSKQKQQGINIIELEYISEY